MSDDDGTSVSQESETSGQANPMEQAPAEPTEAQQEQGADVPLVVDPTSLLPNAAEAAQQFADDEAWRLEHPNQPLMREANPNVGGESFDRYDTTK